MKLEEYKKDSYEFSKITSDLARNFAFAGIAIIWIFKIDKPSDHLIPSELFFPLLCLVLTLVFDIIQYLIPTIIWSLFFLYHEKKNSGNIQNDIKASRWFTLPGWLCFFAKIISLGIAYYDIVLYLIKKL